MGEHICGKSAEPRTHAIIKTDETHGAAITDTCDTALPVPPANFDDFMPYNKKYNSSLEKGARTQPPPKVDISAASKSAPMRCNSLVTAR
jgi:hypothetical protein